MNETFNERYSKNQINIHFGNALRNQPVLLFHLEELYVSFIMLLHQMRENHFAMLQSPNEINQGGVH